MLSSDYLYGGLDHETALLQLSLFRKKKRLAQAILVELRPSFNVGDFSQRQKDLEWRIEKIKKAMVFCDEQIREAMDIINGDRND